MRKAAAREIPPPLELVCLNALWSLEQGSVREVLQLINQNRTLAYTTVMTMLDRLVRRKVATRRKTGRFYIYAPTISRNDMRRIALQEFLDSYFESSREQLLQFLEAEPRPAERESRLVTSIDTVLL